MSKIGKISYLISGLSIVILFVARFILQGWVDILYAPLMFALISLVTAIFVDYKFYLEFLSMRTTKHGMNMGVLILLAFVLVVAVNFLGVRFNKTLDVTKEKINSLSDQSKNIVKNLKNDLNIMIFYKTKRLKEAAIEIKSDFNLYTAFTDRMKVTLHNSDLDVDMAKKYLSGSEAFSVVMEYQGRRVVVPPMPGDPSRPMYQESDITSSILKVTREAPMNIYFLTGHGEKDIEQQALDGLKIFADALKADGYNVSKINFLAGDKMPDSNSVLAIVGPKTAFTENELTLVRNFVKDGGRLLLAIDPGEKHQLALLTKSFGVEFANNYVMNEVVGTDDGLTGAIGLEFDSSSEITKNLPRGSAVLFSFASSLQRAPDAPAENIFTAIVKSHPNSFLSNTVQAPKEPDRKQANLAMSVKGPKLNVVVFGDSDFLTDFRIGTFSHYDLALNTVAALFGDSNNLDIRPKRLETTQMQLTQSKKVFIFLSSVSLPLVLIALSGVFWFRRRNL